jgi:hypothetical protein
MCVLIKYDTCITAVPCDSFAKICEKAQKIHVEVQQTLKYGGF